MGRLTLGAVALGLLSLGTSARAEYLDGYALHELLAALERTSNGPISEIDAAKGTQAMGYVAGTVDAWSHITLCVPPEVRIRQLTAMVRKYLDDNPQTWAQPASVLVTKSVGASFPCKVWGVE